MVCVCCGCLSCPEECSFDVEVDVSDSLGTGSASVSPASCVSCSEVDTNVATGGGNSITSSAYNSASGIGGFGRADENLSGPAATYTRSATVTINLGCDPDTKRRIVEASLFVQDSFLVNPFYPGVGFQKRQTLDISYEANIDIGCADSIDSITAVGDINGVTVNGTSYSWTVLTYDEVCEQLDANQQYQPCLDYLSPDVPEVTVAFQKRAGC